MDQMSPPSKAAIGYAVFGTEPYSGLRHAGDKEPTLFERIDDSRQCGEGFVTLHGGNFIPAEAINNEKTLLNEIKAHLANYPRTPFSHQHSPGLCHSFDEYSYPAQANASAKALGDSATSGGRLPLNIDLMQLNEAFVNPTLIR